jgi:hypothetical protein
VHDALVGEHGAGVDVDADERAAGGDGDGQRRARVVLQDVDAEGHAGQRAPHLGGDDGHGRHRGRGHALGRERRVAVVLDEQRVDAALDEGARVGEGPRDDGVHRAVPAGASGQRRQMDHADERAGDAHGGGGL